MIPNEECVAYTIRAAAWGNITPEEAARQILEALNPTVWPRHALGYGTTGTRRIRKAVR